MRHSQTRRNECTHAISAKLTHEAFEIYKEWRYNRRGGREISNAICAHAKAKADLAKRKEELDSIERKLRSENIHQRQEILMMKKNIAALQNHIKKFVGERDEIGSELSEMFCPKRPE